LCCCTLRKRAGKNNFSAQLLRIKWETQHFFFRHSLDSTTQTNRKCLWLVSESNYKVVQIWPGLFVCKQVTVCPDHIWTTLYIVR
jgi:hypothetical protein